MPILLLLAAAVIVAGVVSVAMGHGGEMAEFAMDYLPPDLVNAADVALLRPPSALWGYNVQVTDEALNRIAQVITERDVEIAVLRQQLAELRSATGSHPAIAATLLARSRAASARGSRTWEASTQEAPTQQVPTQEAGTREGNQCWPGWIAGRAGSAGPPDPCPRRSRRRRAGTRRVTAPRTPSPRVPAPRVPGKRPPAAMTDPGRPPEPGPDGRLRCPWALSAPEELPYHDEEWGRPVRDDRGIFERLCLEAFQSGLSWLTILRKRENFRAAFGGFDPAVVARIRPGRRDQAARGRRHHQEPGQDHGRHRERPGRAGRPRRPGRAGLGLCGGSGGRALRGPGQHGAGQHGPGNTGPVTMAEVPAWTPASKALARELKGYGFSFTGPVTVYAAFQACGVVDDHLRDCFRRGAYRGAGRCGSAEYPGS